MAITEHKPAQGAQGARTADEDGPVLSLVEKLLSEHDPAATPATEFLGARYDAGLAWVWFPEGYGGLGLSPQRQAVVERELHRAGAPSVAERNVIGYGMGAPTVLTHGTDEQKKRLLRPLFTAEEIWCQLFSEPGAGSDVAGLATSAVKDGDEWVVNGQKVWTTLAHMARWGMLLARTDPSVPKHRGMTYFVVDMHAPGVEVRPLRQMTGHAEFNEVFFSDVRIPDSMRLDAVGSPDGGRAGQRPRRLPAHRRCATAPAHRSWRFPVHKRSGILRLPSARPLGSHWPAQSASRPRPPPRH